MRKILLIAAFALLIYGLVLHTRQLAALDFKPSGAGPTAAPTAVTFPMEEVVTYGGQPLASVFGTTFGVENPIETVPLPAGLLSPWDVLRCRAVGIFQNNSGASQNLQSRFYYGAKALWTGTVAVASNPNIRPWAYDFNVVMQGGTALDSFDGLFFLGATSGVAGTMAGAVATYYEGGYESANIDAASGQNLVFSVAVGVPTGAATPTNTPTSGTTPIWRLNSLNCWSGTGVTPTPTPTATP